METKYPALRRPKRKLCYLTKKESPSVKWSGKLTPGDVDRMFDDLDLTSDDDFEVLPPSPLKETPKSHRGQTESEAPPVPQQGHLVVTPCQTVAVREDLHSAKKSARHALDIDADSPFKEHGPVKTSSPIEGNVGVDDQHHERVKAVSPILFSTEEDPKENPTAHPEFIPKQSNGNIKEQSSDYSEMESPPSKVAFSKSKRCSQKTQRNVNPSVSALSQEPQPPATEKNSEIVDRQRPRAAMRSYVGKETTTFLQKLRDAGQPKPVCSRNSVMPVKQPSVQPDPEDDFLILEDEAPFYFSIPKSQKETKPSSADEERSPGKQTKDSQPVTTQKWQQSEKATSTLGSQAANQKMKKRKGKRGDFDIHAASTAQMNSDKVKITEPEDNEEEQELPTTEDLPTGNLMELDKANKNTQQHPEKISVKDVNKLDVQNDDRAGSEMNKEKSTVEVEKEAPKFPEVKTTKESQKNTKSRKAKSLKRTKKDIQTSDAVKETLHAEGLEEHQEQNLKEQVDAEDQCSPPTKEKMNSETQAGKVLANGKAEKNKQPVGSGASSSDDDQVFGKRRRKRPGQWWVSRPQEETEETKIKDGHPLDKVSKKNLEGAGAEASSPVNVKKRAQAKKVLSKHSQEFVEEANGRTSCEIDKEKPTLEVDKKAAKPSQVKRTKSSKDIKEKAKPSRVKSFKKTRKGIQMSDALKDTLCVEVLEEQHQDRSTKGSAGSDDQCPSAEEISEAQPTKGLKSGKAKQSSFEDDQVLGKRKRKQPGLWWVSSSQSADETKATDSQSKQNLKTQRAAGTSPAKVKNDAVKKKSNRKQTEPSGSRIPIRTKKKTVLNQKETTHHKTPDKVIVRHVNLMDEQEEQDFQEQDRSPFVFGNEDRGLGPVFPRKHHYISSEKVCGTPASCGRTQEQAKVREKRLRNPPGNRRQADDVAEDIEGISAQPQQNNAKEHKPPKERKRQFKQNRPPAPETPKNGNAAVSPKLLGASPEPLKRKSLSGLKTVKRCLATYKNFFSSGASSPAVASSRDVHQKYSDIAGGPEKDAVQVRVFEDAGESRSTKTCPHNKDFLQDDEIPSQSPFLITEPCCPTELQQHEDMDAMILSSSRLVRDVLCGVPLKRLALHDGDRANVVEWFNHLWSSTITTGSEITPGHFDWYVYLDRAIGFQVDLFCDSFCNGKILLGSYAKKPLWVDHTAATVYNVFTSTVSVTINCQESRFNPGQSFLVPSGHAYSIQNLSAMPSVLIFHKMFTESPQ